MSGTDAGIVAEGDWLLAPAHEVLDEGGECSPIADLLLGCIGLPQDDWFNHVGVGGRTKPTRQLASLSR